MALKRKASRMLEKPSAQAERGYDSDEVVVGSQRSIKELNVDQVQNRRYRKLVEVRSKCSSKVSPLVSMKY